MNQPVDPPAVASGLNTVAIRLLRRARRADQELGVPPGQLSALSVLVFGGDCTVADLAAAEQVKSPTMTRIVDGLEAAGLAERGPHPHDRRARVVRATRHGRAVMHRGRDRRIDVIADLLAPLDSSELADIEAAVQALSRAIALADDR